MTQLDLFMLLGSAISGTGAVWGVASGKIAATLPGQEVYRDDRPLVFWRHIYGYAAVSMCCLAVFLFRTLAGR